jgi:hypothetical protein
MYPVANRFFSLVNHGRALLISIVTLLKLAVLLISAS